MQQLASIKTSVTITRIQRFHCVGTAVRFAARNSGTVIDNPQNVTTLFCLLRRISLSLEG